MYKDARKTAHPIRSHKDGERIKSPSIKGVLSTGAIPEDSLRIIEDFDSIVASVMPLDIRKKRGLPREIERLSALMTTDRTDRRLGYMNLRKTNCAYINYFMWWNLVRLVRLLSNIEGLDLKAGSVCLDIGTGPLTLPIALWLARPDLRALPMTWYVMDVSTSIMALGYDIYLSVVAKAMSLTHKDYTPWKVVRVQGSIGTKIKEGCDFVAVSNVLNEVIEQGKETLQARADSLSYSISSYTEGSKQGKTVLLVEPGVPLSAALIRVMRERLMERGFMPLSPCPHTGECPMKGRTKSGGKWCNFSFATIDTSEGTSHCANGIPHSLMELSKLSHLEKDRAVLSYIFMKATKAKAHIDLGASVIDLRIVSDVIRLPGGRVGYYACSQKGLVLFIPDKGMLCHSGDLVRVDDSVFSGERDSKSGALIATGVRGRGSKYGTIKTTTHMRPRLGEGRKGGNRSTSEEHITSARGTSHRDSRGGRNG